MIRPLFNGATLFLFCSGIYASDNDTGGGHEAHLHGLAELNLVIEGDSMAIRLESPAANIVGFEHRAESAKQLTAVRQAKQVLESPEQFFVFQGGNCAVDQAEADVSDLMPAPDHHDEAHEHHDSHSDSHSEITAVYHYSCEHGGQLKGVTVDLMSYFPGIEKLNLMWITDSQQGAMELTENSNRIKF